LAALADIDLGQRVAINAGAGRSLVSSCRAAPREWWPNKEAENAVRGPSRPANHPLPNELRCQTIYAHTLRLMRVLRATGCSSTDRTAVKAAQICRYFRAGEQLIPAAKIKTGSKFQLALAAPGNVFMLLQIIGDSDLSLTW